MSLNQTLQEKFPHLELSVLKLSEVQKDNETKRIDSEYFKKEYLEKIQILLPQSQKLSKLMVSGYYGILPKSDDYLENGLCLVRGKDLRGSSLEIANLVKVPFDYFDEHYCIHKNDILFLVKGATIGYDDGVLFIVDEPQEKMIFNGSVFKLQVKNINPAYIYVFMMTSFFTFQKLREVANNGIEYNSLQTIKNYLIPLLPMSFQLEIEKMVKDSHLALGQSKALYKEAEDLLYMELGLNPTNPMQSILSYKINQAGDYHDSTNIESHNDKSNYSIRTLKESFLKTGRLDSEYYQSKYEEIESFIKSYQEGFSKLEITEIKDSNFTPKDKEKYRYIELANIGSNGNISAPLETLGEDLPTRARRLVKEGDLIISSIEGSLGSCALITKEFDNCIVSTGFYILKSHSINTETLLVLFKSVVFQDYLKKFPSGTILSAISKEELQNILIPKINANIQDSIASHIQKSFTLRAEAKALLEEAKAKVESAISGGGGVNSSFVALKIFRIYFPQIKAKLKLAKRHYRLGEWLLLEELLLKDFRQSQAQNDKKDIASCTTRGDLLSLATKDLNFSIRTLKQTLGTSGRLDSEYCQSKYEKNEAVIKSKSYARLKDLVEIKKSIEPGSEAYRESGIPFIRVSNLSAFGITQSEICLDCKDFRSGELESLYPKKGTILLSKDGSVGIAYYVEKDLECVTSGAILHLRIKNKALVLPQYLSLVLNALPTKLQAQRDSGGSIIAHWKISEIENLLIPLLPIPIQEKIESKIAQSQALRAKSKELLEEAKAKVEAKISLF